MGKNARFLRWAILRRLPLFSLIFAALASMAVIYISSRPASYVSTAKLLVQLNGDWSSMSEANRQNAEAAQAQVVLERMLARNALEAAAVRSNLFGKGLNPTRAQIQTLQNAVSAKITSGRGKATILAVTLRGTDADLVERGAQSLTHQVISDVAAQRSASLSTHFDFFRTEVSAIEARLRRQTDELAAFKSTNADSLPDKLAHYLDRQALLEDRLRRDFTTVPRLQETSDQRALAALREDYSEATALYADHHPVVKMLDAKIAMAERMVASAAQSSNTPNASRLEIEAELTNLRKKIASIPRIAAILSTMEREIALSEGLYSAAIDAFATAERQSKASPDMFGQTISLVQPAGPPVPASGKTKLVLLALAIVCSAFIAAMICVSVHRRDDLIHCASRVEARLGLTPFANIPILQHSPRTVLA